MVHCDRHGVAAGVQCVWSRSTQEVSPPQRPTFTTETTSPKVSTTFQSKATHWGLTVKTLKLWGAFHSQTTAPRWILGKEAGLFCGPWSLCARTGELKRDTWLSLGALGTQNGGKKEEAAASEHSVWECPGQNRGAKGMISPASHHP